MPRIIEPATIISIMPVLEDDQVAFGDCADVIFAGVAGRDRLRCDKTNPVPPGLPFDLTHHAQTVKGRATL